MARKKDGKSLLDVIGSASARSGGSTGVPSWFNQAKQDPSAPAADGGEGAERPAPPRAGPMATPSVGEPLFSVSQGRLRISLGQVGAVVVCLAIILLVLGAFLLGRWTLRGTAVPAKSGLDAPFNPGTTHPSLVPRPGTWNSQAKQGDSDTAANGKRRRKGYSYLVIQGGIPTREGAERIRRFLRDKGVDATTYWVSYTHSYKVIDMKGFKSVSSPGIPGYVKQIERLGREYLRQGGAYDFRQSSPTNPWMETAK